MAQDTAHLYLWVPNALLPDGLQVMARWGFTYKSNIVWHKIRKDGGSDGRGVGFYFRNVTELLLFGVRGKNARTLQPGRTLTQFHGFYDHGRALPSLARLDPEPRLWIAPADAEARGLVDGAPIRVFNGQGGFEARAHVTARVPPGTVWMRDGWTGLNVVTSGAAVVPDDAVDLFPFAAGQSAFDAAVEVAPA